MTKRELPTIHALGEEFATVLANLQRTFEERMAAQSGASEEELASPSALLQKHVMVGEVRSVLQAMMNDAVGAILVPRDDRDHDPEALQQAVSDAVVKILILADDKSITTDDARPMIEQTVKDAVSHIPVSRDGHDYDLEVLQQAVNDTVVKIPVPTDGKSVTADDARLMIEQMVKDAVSCIPAPRDGRDYDPEVLSRAVNDAIGRPPVSADRKSITPDDVRSMLEQMVADAVSHIPVPRDGRDYGPEVLQKAVLDVVSALPTPRDGRDVTALEIFPAIDEQKSSPQGTYAIHQGGL